MLKIACSHLSADNLGGLLKMGWGGPVNPGAFGRLSEDSGVPPRIYTSA